MPPVALISSYDYRFVTVSLLIAIFASDAALDLARLAGRTAIAPRRGIALGRGARCCERGKNRRDRISPRHDVSIAGNAIPEKF
jgi:hypothetical protein